MPDGVEKDIAVLTTRIDQVYDDIGSIKRNMEKMANGQEERLRELEQHKAQAEERWESHWKAHAASTAVLDKAWGDHANEHADLKTKERLADIVGSGTAILAAIGAAIFGSSQ